MLPNNKEMVPLRNNSVAREFAVGIAATLIFFTSVLLIPMMGIFVGVFTPLPTLLSFYRYGPPLGLLVPGGALLGGWALFSYLNITQSMPYLMELLLLGLMLAAGMRRKWPLEKTIGAAGLLVFVTGAMIFLQAHSATGGGIFASLEEGLRRTIEVTLQQYAGITPEARLLEESLAGVVPVIVRILPGASLASAFVMAWLNLLMAKRFCEVRDIPLPPWGKWIKWKASELLVWVVIVTGFALLLPSQSVKMVALNLLIILGTIYLFQGLAIISFYFERWKLPKMLRAVFYGFLLLQQFASLGAVLLGLFDVWFDFRRLSKESPSNA